MIAFPAAAVIAFLLHGFGALAQAVIAPLSSDHPLDLICYQLLPLTAVAAFFTPH